MNNQYLPIIKSRIQESGQALVYRYIDGTHRQAMGIKKDLVVDDTVKFYLPLGENFEQQYVDDSSTFPVELFIYKKGNPFYIMAKGTAEKSAQVDSNNERIYCVRMNALEYCELKGALQESFWSKCRRFFANISMPYHVELAI